jgi:hypothetical protein
MFLDDFGNSLVGWPFDVPTTDPLQGMFETITLWFGSRRFK